MLVRYFVVNSSAVFRHGYPNESCRKPPPPHGTHLIEHVGATIFLLEEIRFLHDAEELFLVHFTITIAVSLINHFLELLIRHTFSKLFGNALKILERYLPSFVIIKETESLQDFILRITI